MEESGETDSEAGTLLEKYQRLEDIVLSEFPEIVDGSEVERIPGDAPRNLRIFFRDESFLDIWISGEKYSFHWQSDQDTVRFDNSPHHENLETFPDHMHIDGEVRKTVLEGENLEDRLLESVEYLVRNGFISA